MHRAIRSRPYGVGRLCAGFRAGYSGGGGISCGLSDVHRLFPADRLRLLLSAQEVREVKIVVWKAPKCVRGILRRVLKKKA